jgi:putative SOS response-associated peptidase YedK
VLSFAGLWDRWKNPETDELVISCTIIVTDANALTRPIHDRMPVLLDKTNFKPWLSGAAGTEILTPAPDDRVRLWPGEPTTGGENEKVDARVCPKRHLVLDSGGF